jgi:RNA polymerase subunit RPABC4/transcription elongation factor Spt4
MGWRMCPVCNTELKFGAEGEEQASAAEEGPKCPSCGAAVEGSWKVCPECNSKLGAPEGVPEPPAPPAPAPEPGGDKGAITCQACGEPVEASWRVCPTCNTSLLTGEVVTPPKGTPGQMCTACGAPVDKEWRLCPDCGAELGPKNGEKKLRCSSCNKEVDPAWKMCPFCDSPLDFSKGREPQGKGDKVVKKKVPDGDRAEAKTGTGKLDSDIGLTKARLERLEAEGKNVAKARNLLELTVSFARAGNADKAEKYLSKTRNILDSID